MHGQRIGYVRVSSFDQKPERQLEQVQVDRLFTDKTLGAVGLVAIFVSPAIRHLMGDID